MHTVTSYYSHPSFSTNHRFTTNCTNKTYSQYQMISVTNDRNISLLDYQVPHNSDSVRVSGYHVNSRVSKEGVESRKYQGMRVNDLIQLTEVEETHKRD